MADPRFEGSGTDGAPGNPRRLIPRTDRVMSDPRLVAAARALGPAVVKTAVLAAQELARNGQLDPAFVADAAVDALPVLATTLRPVINATGVVLHTNLGRAQLSPSAVDAVVAAAGYVDVEFDLGSGQRARRGRGAVAALLAAVPLAGDAMIVNNGAAALLLAVTSLAGRGTVLVSRGEMVEIGDGFRLPDLIRSTGVQIVEVGTTNRTTAEDYQRAIRPDTGAIVKIHPSNFRIQGFTSSVPVAELTGSGVPVVVDIGSGLLARDPLLPDEPNAVAALLAGASVVTCSGDKLLGGPQAGLLLGSADVVSRIRRHPLARAVRADKLTLAAIDATLRGPTNPTAERLRADPNRLRSRCQALAKIVEGELAPSMGAVGGGSAPGLDLPGWAVAVPTSLAPILRRGRPPIVGRIDSGRLLLDLRCVPEADDHSIADAVLNARAQEFKT